MLLTKDIKVQIGDGKNKNLSTVSDKERKKKKSGEPSTDATNTVENIQRKMLICQKTNVKKFVDYHKKLSTEINYKRDKNAKPPYSYAVLICLAMMDIKHKVTLDQIYQWVRDNFAYYRHTGSCWQVCIFIFTFRYIYVISI